MQSNTEDKRDDETKMATTANEPASAPSSGSTDTATAEPTATLRDILRANGSEDQYQGIMDSIMAEDESSDDEAGNSTIVFGWQHVEDFVRAIQTAQAQDGDALPPCPFALPSDLTVDSFKDALLDYAYVQGAPARTTNFSLPCEFVSQGMRVASKLQHVDLHPWTRRVVAVGGPDVLPFATVCVACPGSDDLELATEPYPDCLFGPQRATK